MKELRNYQKEAVKTVLKRLKSSPEPVLIDASVGAGKSLIAASILLVMERAGYRSLCLTLNSTLINQNYNTYQAQGGDSGIYCSSLNAKESEKLVIFASANSVTQAIKNEKDISRKPFQLIIVDEAQNISHAASSMYQRIFKHYAHLSLVHNTKFRIIGMTGTPYRGKSVPIYGENEIFKRRDVHIPMSWLIENKFLAKPQFGLNTTESFNFSHLNVNSLGKYNGKELQKVVDSQERLTAEIMREVVAIVRNGRQGAFIFCSTIPHCFEALKALPPDESRIVIGDTPHEERKQIMEDAHNGKVNYLISVSCLLAGVDQPRFDAACFCRPTESLTLYIQAIGRVLRLHPTKTNGALVLDHAGNAQRFQDIDDPIINAALQPKEENEKDYVIPCCACNVLNTVHSRRCIGISDAGRCDNYFEWKDCHHCGAKNDKTVRHCRECETELIDPNAKLTLKAAKPARVTFEVDSAKYWCLDSSLGPSINAMYNLTNGMRIYESFTIRDSRMANIFYGIFVRTMVRNASSYYPVLQSYPHMQAMLKSDDMRTPFQLECVYENDRYIIKKRLFKSEDISYDNNVISGMR